MTSFDFPLEFPIDWSEGASPDEHPNKSHRMFPYYFDDDYGFCFGPCGWVNPIVGDYKFNYDLAIFYDDMDIAGSNFVEGRCSRWDVEDFSMIVETWLKRSDLQTLISKMTPGAAGELYKILGRPTYYDSTWQGNNTIKFYPTPSSNDMPESKLYLMRSPKIGFVKNVMTSPVQESEEWIQIKIECYISGSKV